MKHIFAIIVSLLLLSPAHSQVSPIGAAKKAPFSIGFNNSINPITAGSQKGYATCLVAGSITGWNISINTGTVTVKVWKIAAGTAVPTVANAINTSGLALSTGTHIESTTLTDFTTTAVAAGDIFAFEITAVTGSPSAMTFALRVMPLQ